MSIFLSLFCSLALTLAIEVSLAMLGRLPWRLAIAVNLLTNPVVVLLYHWTTFLYLPLLPMVVLLEVSAILVEGLLYRKKITHPWRWAIGLNILSFTIGWAITYKL